jgi:DNA-binding NtrC family response regulator
MVRAGTFREDLYYRLNVVEISLPPLRERKEDILLLFNSFLEEICLKNHRKMPHVDNAVFNVLLQHSWPGNIRELRNAVQYMLVVSRTENITRESLPPHLVQTENRLRDCECECADPGLPDETSLEALDEILRLREVEMIKKTLSEFNGNKKKTAQALNIPRSTLYYKLNQLGLDTK